MVMVYDMNDETINNETVICCLGMFILFLILVLSLSVGNTPVDKTEEIVYKDISHISSFGNDVTYYNIYTKDNKFQMSLVDYNQLDIGDNLTVCYNNSSFIPYTVFDNQMYFAD